MEPRSLRDSGWSLNGKPNGDDGQDVRSPMDLSSALGGAPVPGKTEEKISRESGRESNVLVNTNDGVWRMRGHGGHWYILGSPEDHAKNGLSDHHGVSW